MPAKEQLSTSIPCLVGGAVGLLLGGAEQVDDRVAPCGEELGDQAPVAPLPRCLGAHEARRGLGERTGERLLPLRLSHAGGVAAERRRPDAGEALLTGLACSPAAELDRVAVRDSRRLERLAEPLLPELGGSARAGEAA